MPYQTFTPPDDPQAALDYLRDISRHAYVLILKKSTTCAASSAADRELHKWLDDVGDEQAIAVVEIDVNERRELARGLTDLLEIAHESPQAVVLANNRVLWHGSQFELTAERYREVIR